MSTVSTDAIYQLIRTRLLTYVDPDGNTLAEALGTRLWRLSPPDNLKASDYPFAVIGLKSPQMPEGSHRIKLTYDLEVLFFGRPVGSHAALEALGDRALSALVTWRDASDGLVWVGDATVQSIPTLPAPADPDVQQVRVLASFSCYPTLLTRFARVGVGSIAVSPATFSLAFPATRQMTATVRDVDGNLVANPSIAWSSANTAIAAVDATGLVSVRGTGSVVITATSGGLSATATATTTAPPLLVPTLDFNPFLRPFDLADPLVLVSNTGRTGYQDGVPQHLGSGLLGTTPRVSYPKSADEWGFVAPVDGPMSKDYVPGVHNGTSTQIDGIYPNTAAYTIAPSGTSTAHFTALDDRWQALPSADNQDASTFKRSLGCVLLAATPADVGKVVRVNLLDNSHFPAGDWTGANVVAFQDVTLLHSLSEIDHTSATASLAQHVAITFPDSASQAATPNPQLFISIPGASLVGYAVAPYMARGWQAEDSNYQNWLRPIPFHSTLGVISTDIYCNCWSEDSDLPTLYGGAVRASTAIAAPDSNRYFGGRTLSQYTLGVGDGITTTALVRIEDGGGTPPTLTNTPVTSAWIHWYVEPASGHALPLDTDLVAYLAASGTGTLAEDTVARGDNLTSPGSMDTGQAWIVQSGVWGVFGNTLQLQTAVAEGFIYVDTATGDGTVDATLFAVGNDGSVVFRITNANNLWRLLWESGVLYLQKNVAGGGFNTVTSASVTINAGDRIGVVLSGSSISPTHNGVTISAMVATDAFNATATKHGLGATNNGPRYSHFKFTGTGSLHTYGPITLTRDSTRYGSALARANGGQFFRARFNINQASEGYLDFRPRIVNASSGQLVLNAYRAAVTTEGARGMGLHSAWVPKRTVTGRQFGDAAFEIIPNIASILDPANMVLGMRQVHPWQPSDLDNLNGAGSSGIFPSFWQSGPYGTASDGGLAADVTHNGDGTFSMTFFAERVTGPAGQLSWTIHINGISAALASAQWTRMTAIDVFVIVASGAVVSIGFGLGAGTGITWYGNGDAFFGGTVSFEAVAGADWRFDVAGFSDPGHMGLAADLDRVRQSGWIQAILASVTVNPTTVKSSIEYHIAAQWGARKDYR